MPRSGSHNNPATNSLQNQSVSGSPERYSSAQQLLPLYEEKMRNEGLPAPVIDLFATYFSDIANKATGYIHESTISPVSKQHIDHINDLARYTQTGKEHAKEAVAIKLNGGLGTTMGMQFAKSLLPVKDNLSFLDITIQQAISMQEEYGGSLPLVLMNSYNTHKDTLNELRHMSGLPQLPLCFVQHKFPKIEQHTLEPVSYPDNPDYEWNPPGHGDIFAALYLSGVLETLLRQGRKYALISNIDNLGATLDMRILGYMAEKQVPFLMEVTERTESDCKGGHIARHEDGSLILREIGQCPECDIDTFNDIQKHCLFNTNNIWINLAALKEHIQQKGLPKLPLIRNPKPVNPHDNSSTPVYQIESAMGAAVSHFADAQALITNRDRFIPVKQTNDLLKVMSDYYLLDTTGMLKMNNANITQNLQVQLDPQYYGSFDSIYEKFKEGVPSLTACSKLGISGDIIFNSSISLVGDVSINNQTGNILLLPDNLTFKGAVEIK
ncbi:UTP--glucose-1-phosphate uridylyltransferase [Halodesulfovibrio spirochaetisodalis]|uniref:UTP--glucose-1-phosphate uridylyltransferase n=1 Tax=Halodesulfovibrio spirochaetisodalis TaxID=1560234 RepID=UPI0009EEB052|nr:UTP--glucose-1-phosphate uridylyltransferase [Halodesulfovibrio spirochaetisodalis]